MKNLFSKTHHFLLILLFLEGNAYYSGRIRSLFEKAILLLLLEDERRRRLLFLEDNAYYYGGRTKSLFEKRHIFLLLLLLEGEESNAHYCGRTKKSI